MLDALFGAGRKAQTTYREVATDQVLQARLVDRDRALL